MSDNGKPRPIVVGYDGSPQAHDALALGVELAAATGERLVIAGAYGPGDALHDDELDARRAQVLEALGEAAGAVPPDVEASVERRAVMGRSAAAALHDLAETEHPRVLVVGSCHRGAIGRVLVGSVGERLVQGAPCPVAVAPRGFAEGRRRPLRRLCVAFDGRPEAWTAVQRAAQLGAAAGAQLRVAMVVPPLTGTPTMPVVPPEILEQRLKAAEVELDHAVRSVSRRLDADAMLLKGDPASRLSEAAAEMDLLVVGSRAYGPVRRVLLGSVSAAVMHSAPCPVMVVPRGVEFDPTAEGMAAEDELAASG
jgi:nucleotide-binding universal stress UspA family protein